MRALYHLFIDATRRVKRRQSASRCPATMQRRRRSAKRRAPSASPKPGECNERLAAVWGQLDAEQKALLSLHAEGHDLEELAAIFRRDKNALSARLHRARQRAREAACRRRGYAGASPRGETNEELRGRSTLCLTITSSHG
jgi:DNA-directed RNA polymerase specialized sigma24 family protein